MQNFLPRKGNLFLKVPNTHCGEVGSLPERIQVNSLASKFSCKDQEMKRKEIESGS